jgi:hypothetical protein
MALKVSTCEVIEKGDGNLLNKLKQIYEAYLRLRQRIEDK